MGLDDWGSNPLYSVTMRQGHSALEGPSKLETQHASAKCVLQGHCSNKDGSTYDYARHLTDSSIGYRVIDGRVISGKSDIRAEETEKYRKACSPAYAFASLTESSSHDGSIVETTTTSQKSRPVVGSAASRRPTYYELQSGVLQLETDKNEPTESSGTEFESDDNASIVVSRRV